MRIASAALALALVSAGCSNQATADDAGGRALERAAIAAGVIRDPAGSEMAGLYALGTDRVCIVADAASAGAGGYRIGASVDYGTERCSARGTVSRSGETLRIAFDRAPGCSFDARLEQDRIVFPGDLPAACQRLCSPRASLAALEAELQSEATSEATAMRDSAGRALCRS